ncbi:MAG TPA: aminotransferase class I/II-fold pyridoxal phosphate-dependent enzyme [Candidatus Binataceae bacterium]|nr:aminotransferase class I/II-fold pyridoxal phosphate-dependent enzyme [Candidatus Binataceae bacterium]
MMPKIYTGQRLAVDRFHGGADREGLLDFSANLNPLGPPPEAIEAYNKAVILISSYPPPYPRALEASIADSLKIDSECILAANGSTQLIYLLARVLKLRSPRVVIPTFSEIANALVSAGSEPLPLLTRSWNGFRLDQRNVHAALRSGADGIFLGRPNSPTGTLISVEEAAEIAAQCHQYGAWCVFDEAFIEFADDSRSLVHLAASSAKLLVLRSLTKIYAIAGLRLGYLVGDARVVEMLRDAIEPWSVNVAAEAVGLACLRASKNYASATRDLVVTERRRIEDGLNRSAKFRVFSSSANFIMAEVQSEKRHGDLARHLLSAGIIARDLSTLPGCGLGFYRFGIRTRQDNEKLIAVLADY